VKGDSQKCPVVYLAGGFHSRWQDVVRARLPDLEYLDPRDHNLESPEEYTAWDLQAVRQCDVVFGNMETSNPGGYALALEVGYAKALGKRIYLVDSLGDQGTGRYFEMVRQCADLTFEDLESAIIALGGESTYSA
jgi:nucleoside 2-deoxyribosyltransferase